MRKYFTRFTFYLEVGALYILNIPLIQSNKRFMQLHISNLLIPNAYLIIHQQTFPICCILNNPPTAKVHSDMVMTFHRRSVICIYNCTSIRISLYLMSRVQHWSCRQCFWSHGDLQIVLWDEKYLQKW